ncbi:MAG: TonB-dependent receptor [Candidatus Aminicenantes bacterium]|nr:TonB-dependent receptor [Candidatus Aminicenantes bacterium]
MKSRFLAGLIAFVVFASPLLAQTKEKTLDELLSLDMTDLANLKVVSALKSLEMINRVPATVRVITAEQIRDNGYLTLEDALADLPGFQFRNILGFNSYAFIRGVPSQNNKILLLVDGIQTNELNSGGYYGGGQYNLANVDRIEVVYGPASALYGTNAVSGIINIITLDPKDAPGGRASVLAGSYRTYQADVRYAAYGKKADFGFSIAGMLKRSDKADLKGAAGDFNWTENMENFENDASLDARVRYKNFSAGLMFQDKDASYATAQMGLTAPGMTPISDHGVNWHIRFLNTWAAYAYDRAKTWSIRSTVYYRDTTVLDDTIPIIELPTSDAPGRQSRYYRPNHSIGNESQLRWTPDARWRLSFGLVLEQERLAETISISQSVAADMRPAVPAAPDMLTNSLISLYAQSQTSLSKTIDLFLGLRHDESSYYGAVTTPRLGFVFNQGKLTTKILYMQAFRAPKPWDYTNGIGNPDLGPEKIASWEAAGGWSFSPHLRFDVSAYHNRLSNLLVRESQGDQFRWINAGALTTDGCETGLEFRQGRLKAYLNYTYTRSINALDEQAPEIAPHGGNAGILYAFTPRFRISLRGQYLGRRKNSKIIPTTGNDRIDAALLLHAALTLSLPWGIDCQLVVNNLLDAVYYHPSILPPSRYRQPQRSIRLSMGYAF